jgi:hypothetical protein
VKLGKAAREQRYVTLRRRRGWDEVTGYVVGVGERWVAVAAVPLASFEGLVFVRRKDVRRLVDARHARRAEAGLRMDDLWPPALPESVDLDDVRSLLFSVGALSRTLGFSDERRASGLFVAQVVRITQRRLESREVTPNGRWGASMTIDLDRLTRVVLWDPYVERITAIADAPR